MLLQLPGMTSALAFSGAPICSNPSLSIHDAHPFNLLSFLSSAPIPSSSASLPFVSSPFGSSAPAAPLGDMTPSSSTVTLVKSCAKRSMPPKTVRVFDEKCVVCADRATGLHYSVPSCNGCKTFFRRSIVSGRHYTCSKNGQSTLDKKGRCVCRVCRLQRCLNAGMDSKDEYWFQYAQRSPYSTRSSISSSQNDATSSRFASNNLSEMLGEALTNTPITSSGPSSTRASPVSSQFETQSSVLHSKEYVSGINSISLLRDLVTREVKMHGLRRSGSYKGGFLLDMLTKPPAIDATPIVPEICESPIFSNDEEKDEYWLNYELSMSIEYAKTHEVFMNLSYCDKCVLLEDNHLAIFLFTAAYEAYFKDTNELKYSNGDTVRFGEGIGSPNNLIQIMKRCYLDRATFALSKAILFLNPDACGLSLEGKKLVNHERDRYTRLLSAYTFERFGSGAASILAESIFLSATALALGRQMRCRPPADASLLYILTPLSVRKDFSS